MVAISPGGIGLCPEGVRGRAVLGTNAKNLADPYADDAPLWGEEEKFVSFGIGLHRFAETPPAHLRLDLLL